MSNTEARVPEMISISSIWVPDDMPNRSKGWEKQLNELVESIKTTGQVTPILVRRFAEGQQGPNGEIYRLVDGQRRIEAHKNLKRTTIKAVAIPSTASKKEEYVAHVVANFGRLNLTPLEEAVQIEYAVKNLEMSQQDVAKASGKTSGWVSQRMTLLKETPEVQNALEKGDITFTHVRDLSRLKDPDQKEKFLNYAREEGAAEFKERVDRALGNEPKPRKEKNSGAAEAPAPATHGDTRPKKEALEVLGKLDKAFVAAKKAEEKEKAAHFSGVIKGLSWAYKLKGAKLPL